MLGFHPCVEIWHNEGGRVVSSTRKLHFTAKEISWYSFFLENEWTPRATECGQKD